MSVEKTEIETFFGRCRCCLSYGYLKNMWSEHQFEGVEEIYGEMLVQCFALTWEYSEDSVEQDQICEQCIGRLREANNFKKLVLESQGELLQQIDAENEIDIKEEILDEDFVTEGQRPESEADTMDTNTEYTMDTADTLESVKDETEYEEIEYLEDEDAAGTNDAVDTDLLQPKSQLRPVQRRKQPRQPDTDEEGPKRKWPKKLPKSERHKTYKQYSEVDLQKCLEEIRNNELTASEASLKYNIPRKTICAKIRSDPNEILPAEQKQVSNVISNIDKDCSSQHVRTDIQNSTNNTTTRKRVTRSKTRVQTLSTKQTDAGTESHEVPDTRTVEKNEESKDLMLKHKNNLKMILKYSNATLFKRYSAAGYSCYFCGKYFSPENLKIHNFKHGDVYEDAIKAKYVGELIINLDITGLECTLCEEEMNSLEELIKHLQEIHNKTFYTDIDNHFIPFKFENEKLQCVVCGTEFKYFYLLSEHMCEHYSNYKCTECERVFINKQSMLTHRSRHKNGEYKCSACPKIFESQMKLREHENVAHKLSSEKRKCGFCYEKFSSADLVSNHETAKHGVIRSRLNCEDCDKSFTSRKGLETHKKRHLSIHPFKCETCDKGFHTRQELNWHIVTHTKTKNFRCDKCNNCFGTQPALYQHMRAHRGYRKYKCDYCEMAFVHLSNWKMHILALHGKKPGSTRNRFK